MDEIRLLSYSVPQERKNAQLFAYLSRILSEISPGDVRTRRPIVSPIRGSNYRRCLSTSYDVRDSVVSGYLDSSLAECPAGKLDQSKRQFRVEIRSPIAYEADFLRSKINERLGKLVREGTSNGKKHNPKNNKG